MQRHSPTSWGVPSIAYNIQARERPGADNSPGHPAETRILALVPAILSHQVSVSFSMSYLRTHAWLNLEAAGLTRPFSLSSITQCRHLMDS